MRNNMGIYRGNKNPIHIVAKWLADHPEPKPLPDLPEKLYSEQLITLATLGNKINAIIDYLAAREDNNGRA